MADAAAARGDPQYRVEVFQEGVVGPQRKCQKNRFHMQEEHLRCVGAGYQGPNATKT